MSIKRVIACMDIKDGRVVKGVNFLNLRDAGDPVELAAVYSRQKADEVFFLDIAADDKSKDAMIDMLVRASQVLEVPFGFGGGLRTVSHMEAIFAKGAAKVSIGSAAIARPELLSEAARTLGKQAIVCAIDAKQIAGNPNKWEVYASGGKKATGLDAVEWAQEAERRGAGEILLTSMDRDGSCEGFDCALTRSVVRAVEIPVIASGGAGSLEQFAEVVIDGEADAVLAASIFHFGTYTVSQVKEYMCKQGISVSL